VCKIPLLSSDMRGMEGVSQLSDIIVKQSEPWADILCRTSSSSSSSSSSGSGGGGGGYITTRSQRVVLMGGKGGVGKTSSAAALALACARLVFRYMK
jgi:Mrp family chromosome partitioning ATPase